MTINRSPAVPIERAQSLLKDLGFYKGTIDGDFGPKTHNSVVNFQQAYLVDGIVDAVTHEALVKAQEAWDARPMPKLSVPDDLSELTETFGIIEYEEADGGNVRIINGWANRHIRMVDLPIVGRHQIHTLLVEILEDVLNMAKDRGLDKEFKQFGVWCPRHKMHNPNRSLSTHSWAIACDVNWATNMPGAAGDLHPGIVECFELHGFEWGGRWRHRDDMHFQYATNY